MMDPREGLRDMLEAIKISNATPRRAKKPYHSYISRVSCFFKVIPVPTIHGMARIRPWKSTPRDCLG